ncbi:MAG: putative metal-binding motif-containing protein [Kofleriaceae bacterium]|nr:putative metal-binding motif-containing protein [Kofleriaceae bacterium]
MSGRVISVAVVMSTALASPARAEDCSLTGVGELGFALVEHSCFHAEFGPFAEVTATPGTTPTSGTPNIDPVHTYYGVTLTPDQPNVVTYQPVRTGTWAIFGATDVPHRVFDSGGTELPVLLTHVVADCPALPTVRVFSFTAQERYTIVIGPTPSTLTPVVVEKVSDFEQLHGRDGDGDGFGGEDDTISTACVPPEGYVSDLGDCDDTNPAIHPNAEEVCDGMDQNCNGEPDDDACEVGGGGGCTTAASQDDRALAAFGVMLVMLYRRRRPPRRES